MEAGREMDRLIAEKVMGYEWEHDGDYSLMRLPGTNWCAMEINRGEPYYGMLPEFSTDIAAAWTVVERLDTSGADYRTWKRFMDALRGGEFDSINTILGRRARDLAAMICRAALAATEVE